jgi:hypothetical protein
VAVRHADKERAMNHPVTFSEGAGSASGFWGDLLSVMNQYHDSGRTLQHWVVTFVWSRFSKNIQCVVDNFGDLVAVGS